MNEVRAAVTISTNQIVSSITQVEQTIDQVQVVGSGFLDTTHRVAGAIGNVLKPGLDTELPIVQQAGEEALKIASPVFLRLPGRLKKHFKVLVPQTCSGNVLQKYNQPTKSIKEAKCQNKYSSKAYFKSFQVKFQRREAYAQELPYYGLKVGLTNYVAAYDTMSPCPSSHSPAKPRQSSSCK
ncbi:hypothetical protein KIW84_021977 [Lathyrus oleraceus]|uniref:Uncharacterized protein n=1 Tax=Pisum sativum TaxID=3888 RepID=A0A9D4YAJ7_PEA|nr:hypothetical protein KIW84_021977 [Pisum sativum]